MSTQYGQNDDKTTSKANLHLKMRSTRKAFCAARDVLGPEKLADIFRVTTRTIYSWGQDLDSTQDRGRNPLDPLYTMFEELDDYGRADVARAMARLLMSAIEEDVPGEEAQQLLDTLEEESLADYKKLAGMHSAMDQGKHPDMIAHMADLAKEEIDRTVALYRQQWEKNQ